MTLAQPEVYGDGGFSGGTLNRPGVQRLLNDVREGLVDVIVVYKIDRLSRSLADFLNLVGLASRSTSFMAALRQKSRHGATPATEIEGAVGRPDTTDEIHRCGLWHILN